MNRSPEPLSAEERELAQRLAKLDARREPGPALDAAILAAARAAVGQPPVLVAATPRGPADAVQGDAVQGDTAQRAAGPQAASGGPQAGTGVTQSAAQNAAQSKTSNTASNVVAMPPRKPMARWPLGLSLAASLVLAAGIGWRLADGGGSESAAEQAAVSMPASEQAEVYADAAASAEPTEAVMLEPEMNRVPPPPPPPLAAEESALRKLETPQPEMRRQAERAAVASAEAEHDAFMMDEGVAQEAAPAGAAAADAGASAFPAAPPAAAKTNSIAGNAEGAVGRSRDARETAKSDRGEALDKVEVVGSRVARQAPAAAAPVVSAPPAPPPPPPAPSVVADQPYDDQPPVTADSPQFRQAWLQRIRKQLAQGQPEAARESLQEFRRRYPDVELPDDLKKVAASLPPPTP